MLLGLSRSTVSHVYHSSPCKGHPANLTQLWEALESTGASIYVNRFQHLVESIPPQIGLFWGQKGGWNSEGVLNIFFTPCMSRICHFSVRSSQRDSQLKWLSSFAQERAHQTGIALGSPLLWAAASPAVSCTCKAACAPSSWAPTSQSWSHGWWFPGCNRQPNPLWVGGRRLPELCL